MRDIARSPITSSQALPDAGGPLDAGQREAVSLDAPDAPSPHLDATAPADPHDAFTEIARAIVGRSSASEVAQIVVEEARHLVPADRCVVGIWRPERDAFHVLAVAGGAAVPGLHVDDEAALDQGHLRAVLERARPMREIDLRRRQTPIAQQLCASGLRSSLAVPVFANGTPMGFISASSRHVDAYTAAHERLLTHVAVHLALGLEQARLNTDARLHQARLLGLQRVGQRLAASVAGDDALDIVLEEAVRSVGGDTGALLAWDEARGVLVPLRNTVPTAAEYTVLRPGEGVAGRAIQEMHVTVLHDYQGQSGDETPAGKAGVRAAIGAPLVLDGRLLGAVTANTTVPNKRFDSADMQVFQLYAGQAAAVMTTVRRFETERRQRRGAEEAARAAAAVVSEMDQQRRLDLIVERAVKIVGGSAGSLMLADARSETVQTGAQFGHQAQPDGTPVPLDTSVARRVISERRAVLVDAVATAAAAANSTPAWNQATPYPQTATSSIGVPVMARGELLGALVVEAATAGPNLTSTCLMPEDVPLIQLIADLAAVALDNARSLEREQQRRRQIDAVRSVTAELTRELDLPSLLDLILLRASQFVHCESTVVLLWDEATKTLVPTAWRGLGDWVATTRLGVGDGAAGAAARLREGVVVEDYRHWNDAIHPVPDEAGPTSVMAVPITYQDRMIGVLSANRFGMGESFNRHDLEVLEVFGTQAAIAIENARLFEQATTAEALRELAQLKAELLNTVSHEFRTPLSLIHGYAELLVHRADRLSAAEVSQMSGEIYTSSKTLARLVDDLLDFSHLERGRLQLRRQRLNLSEMLRALVRSFHSQPGGERITADLDDGLLVDADPERLHQVVGNLLSNALSYTTQGSIMVQARRDDDRIRVEVEDHGPGLSSEEVGRIWESFYRGAEAAQLPNRGSGLGLTVVKQLVELHGGRVGVRSAPGQGATFWFTLPATAAE
jgi:signal transduction histidine kinase